jgi:flagellar P-ring protein precursor FlgI
VKRLLSVICLCAGVLAPPAVFAGAKDEVRIKDLGRIDGWRENQLVGYGIVTGLAGTGDSARSRATRQSIANLLSQFELYVPNDQIQSRNVAAVMVIAKLPAFSSSGDKVDVTITSIGDARSLLGGALLLTPLKGPDNLVHALAQGSLSVGGYKYDLNGNVVQKNHPTVGMIPGGATVELAVATNVLKGENQLSFILADPDYTTATRIAESLNSKVGAGAIARAADAGRVNITVPPGELDRLVDFMTRVENVAVEPDHRAMVVVNERTGSVISGGNVRISSVTVSHGELKVSISTDYLVSQPFLVRATGPGVRTEVVPRTRIDVQESESGGVVEASDTVADLVRALNKIKTHPRDMISILQGIKAAGALHAELIIQ